MTRVLSYGGGLDSFAMLVEGLARGERPDVVCFVDVADPEHQDPGEWPGTYRHIDEVVRPLCAREGIELAVVDSTRYPVRDARSLFAWLWERHQIPVAGPNRICTIVAKVERFERWMDDRFPGQADFWAAAQAILGCDCTPALPCKKAATTAAEVEAFCTAARPTHLHLLGLGVRNREAAAYLQATTGAPCLVSVDSNVLAANIGNTGGPGGGPRRVTLARRWGERLAAAGRMARNAVTEFSTMLAFGGRELSDEHDAEAAAIARGDLLAELPLFAVAC